MKKRANEKKTGKNNSYTKTQLRTGKLKPSLKSYNGRIEKFKKSSPITPEDILFAAKATIPPDPGGSVKGG